MTDQDFVDVYRKQIELKVALQRASHVLELKKQAMPEYIDYIEKLDAYKQSKVNSSAAYTRFKQEVYKKNKNLNEQKKGVSAGSHFMKINEIRDHSRMDHAFPAPKLKKKELKNPKYIYFSDSNAAGDKDDMALGELHGVLNTENQDVYSGYYNPDLKEEDDKVHFNLRDVYSRFYIIRTKQTAYKLADKGLYPFNKK